MKNVLLAFILSAGFWVTTLQADEIRCERYYDPYQQVYYDYSPYSNYGMYRSGYYYTSPSVHVSYQDRKPWRRHHDSRGYGRRGHRGHYD